MPDVFMCKYMLVIGEGGWREKQRERERERERERCVYTNTTRIYIRNTAKKYIHITTTLSSIE